MHLDLVHGFDPEDPALATGVGGLQDGREADLVGRPAALGERPQCGEPRLGHARLGEPAAHRHLVGHQVGRLDPDPRQAERLGDRRPDGHGAVGRDRQHAVDAEPPHRGEHGCGV